MRSSFANIARVTSILTVGLAGLTVFASEATDLLTPTKRTELLAQAVKLQQTKAADGEIPNPFYPAAFAAAGASAAETQAAPAVAGAPTLKGTLAGQALLQAIAAGLKPSGAVVLGGQQNLLFGQKRVKAGGTLTITFEGTEYILEIASIDRTHFTLRLNREEFTRPIK
jgi:hypothetical protein